MSVKSTVTDSSSTKHYQSFAQWSQWEGAEIHVNLSNDEERGIEGYDISDEAKKVDANSTSNISTRT